MKNQPGTMKNQPGSMKPTLRTQLEKVIIFRDKQTDKQTDRSFFWAKLILSLMIFFFCNRKFQACDRRFQMFYFVVIFVVESADVLEKASICRSFSRLATAPPFSHLLTIHLSKACFLGICLCLCNCISPFSGIKTLCLQS